MIGDRIKTLRGLLGLTQSDLANLMQVSRGSVSDYEHERNFPSTVELENLHQAEPHVNLEWLIIGKGYALLNEDSSIAKADSDLNDFILWYQTLTMQNKQRMLQLIRSFAELFSE